MNGVRTAMLALGLGLVACAPASPDRGTFLGDGTARATFDAHSDGAEPFSVEVAFPAHADGSPIAGPHEGAVLLPGALVDPTRYRWLARSLAAHGYVVALVDAPHGLAFADPERAEIARELLRSERGLLKGLVADRVAAMGHAEGGTAAAERAVDGRFAALVLLGAEPTAGTEVQRLTIPSLAVAGGADCAVPPADVAQGFDRLPPPAFLATVDGASHLSFTDDDRDDTGPGCAPTIGIEEAHARIGSTVQLFLDGALRGDAAAFSALVGGAHGVQVEAR